MTIELREDKPITEMHRNRAPDPYLLKYRRYTFYFYIY
jgi:hypothetical protein